MKRKRYVVAFAHRTTHDRRSFTVWAYNKLDADVAGYKLLAALVGDDWRTDWWPIGAMVDTW